MAEVSFEWGLGSITVDGWGVMANKIAVNTLFAQLDVNGIENAIEREYTKSVIIYMVHTVRITGDVGFALPTERTPEQIRAFLADVFKQDEALLNLWDKALSQTRTFGNDADLLPTEQLPEAKKKTKK